jgi:hypothetical protein
MSLISRWPQRGDRLGLVVDDERRQHAAVAGVGQADSARLTSIARRDHAAPSHVRAMVSVVGPVVRPA